MEPPKGMGYWLLESYGLFLYNPCEPTRESGKCMGYSGVRVMGELTVLSTIGTRSDQFKPMTPIENQALLKIVNLPLLCDK